MLSKLSNRHNPVLEDHTFGNRKLKKQAIKSLRRIQEWKNFDLNELFETSWINNKNQRLMRILPNFSSAITVRIICCNSASKMIFAFKNNFELFFSYFSHCWLHFYWKSTKLQLQLCTVAECILGNWWKTRLCFKPSKMISCVLQKKERYDVLT